MDNMYKTLCLNIVRQAISDCVDDSLSSSTKRDAIEFLHSKYSKFLSGSLSEKEQQHIAKILSENGVDSH